jgi:cytochrome c peroxidase
MESKLKSEPRRSRLAACLAALLLACAGAETTNISGGADARSNRPSPAQNWSPSELAWLTSLSIDALEPVPDSSSNRVATDRDAATLGHLLFFDAGLSANGQIACATCHEPVRLFTDGRATSEGLGTTARNAPTLVGAAHSTWMYWDGRRDSLWAQALAPLEASVEMGSTRVAVARRATTQSSTRPLYRRVFGITPDFGDATRFPPNAGPFGDVNARAAWNRMSPEDRRAIDRSFANVGKAIAAYERLLRPGPSRFDRYVRSLRGQSRGTPADPAARLTESEVAGLRLFISVERTLCLRCHNGPLLTNQSFHDIGTAATTSGVPDFGRFLGVQSVLIDPFNCLGPYSDAAPEDCGHLRFLDKTHVGSEVGKFKTPTLRGLSRTEPYLHDGRFATLAEVIEHYRNPGAGKNQPLEITPLDITDIEARALVAFLETLDGDVAVDPRWLEAPRDEARSTTPIENRDEPVEGRTPMDPAASRSESGDVISVRSERGDFDVFLWPDERPVPLRRLHGWTLRIEDASGRRVTPIEISVDGGMPQHAHGFETKPRVTARFENGDYRIEGVKFHMSGAWQMKIHVAADGIIDEAVFEIEVGP